MIGWNNLSVSKVLYRWKNWCFASSSVGWIYITDGHFGVINIENWMNSILCENLHRYAQVELAEVVDPTEQWPILLQITVGMRQKYWERYAQFNDII